MKVSENELRMYKEIFKRGDSSEEIRDFPKHGRLNKDNIDTEIGIRSLKCFITF